MPNMHWAVRDKLSFPQCAWLSLESYHMACILRSDATDSTSDLLFKQQVRQTTVAAAVQCAEVCRHRATSGPGDACSSRIRVELWSFFCALLWRQTHVLVAFVFVSDLLHSTSVPSHIFCGEASATEKVIFENATCGSPILCCKMSFRVPEGKKKSERAQKPSTLLVFRSWLVTHFLCAFVSIVFSLNAGGVFPPFFPLSLRLVFLSGHNKSNLSPKPLKHRVNRQKRLEKIWATAETRLPLH